MDTLYRMFQQQFHCKPECTWLEQQGRAHYRGYCWLILKLGVTVASLSEGELLKCYLNI